MSRNRPVQPRLSFDHLYADEECCREFGRVTLAAGMLETELRAYLSMATSLRSADRCSLGRLVDHAKKHGLLEDLQASLEMVVGQRNRLAHCVHSVLTGTLRDELLAESDLIASDVSLYTERAWQLALNLRAIAELVARRRASPGNLREVGTEA